MKKMLISAAFVAAAMLGSATPSSAASVNLGEFGFATNGNLASANIGRVTGAGGFTDDYDFTLTSAAILQSSGVQGANYSGINIQLAAVGGGASFTPGPNIPDFTVGTSAFSNQTATSLTAGVYELIVTGVGLTSGLVAQYVGQLRLTFEAPSAVPIPGALPLFASVLGIGGYLRYRRKRNEEAVPA